MNIFPTNILSVLLVLGVHIITAISCILLPVIYWLIRQSYRESGLFVTGFRTTLLGKYPVDIKLKKLKFVKLIILFSRLAYLVCNGCQPVMAKLCHWPLNIASCMPV